MSRTRYPEAPTYERAQGETDPIDLQVTQDGQPANLDGSTWTWSMADSNVEHGEDFDVPDSPYFTTHTRDHATVNTVDSAEMEVLSPLSGEIRWTPTEDDMSVAGVYEWQVKGVLADGTIIKLPRDLGAGRLIIHPSLA